VRRLSRSLLISLFLSTFLTSLPSFAQNDRGTIAGVVTDTTGAILPGARVELVPSGQNGITNSQGLFTLNQIAAGSYTLKANYVGFTPTAIPVTVTANSVSNVTVQMQVGAMTSEILVTAERPRGEAESINEQKNAANIMQVLPAEVITSLPNTNIADAVGRLPSVTLERDEGEGKYVQIRGTEPRLSNTTIDNVNVPSPEGTVRNIKLDVIPASLVNAIQVSKTLSANQDGDAIGGSVNLVTRSASDQPYLSFSGLGGYNPILGGRPNYEFTGAFAQRFGTDRRWGLALGGSYDYNGRGITDVEPGPTLVSTAADPNTFFPSVPGEDIRVYKYDRKRSGFGGTLDYRIAPGSTAYLRGLFANFIDYGDTWAYSPGLNTPYTDSPTSGDGGEAYRHYIRRPTQQIFSLNAGATHVLGLYTVNYEAAVSRGAANGANNFPTANFSNNNTYKFTVDRSNPLRPRIIPVDPTVNIYDPTQYSLSKISFTNDHAAQLNLQASGSIIRGYTFGKHIGAFEVGGKFRNAHKFNDVHDTFYNATDPNGSTIKLASVLGTFQAGNDYYDGSYKVGPLSDYNKILAAYRANMGEFALDTVATHQRSDPANFNTLERVAAGYLMNTIDIGHVSLQTGLRIEATNTSTAGFQVQTDPTGTTNTTTRVTAGGDYIDLLPSIQFKYGFNSNTNLRLAYGRGIARPNFGDQSPQVLFDPNASGAKVIAGNPNLKPTHANNFDVLFERYFEPLGVIQAGFFYKDISDPIYQVQRLLTTGPFVGQQEQLPVNGPKAHIAGVELSIEQRLSFLPGVLSGAGIFANYSYAVSRAAVPNAFDPTVPGAVQTYRSDNPSLQRQAPTTWNIGPTYDRGRLSVRTGISYNGANIFSYNFSDGGAGGLHGPNGDVYLYSHLQVDAQGSFRLHRGWIAEVQGLNLNNEVFGFYQGAAQYPIQREYYKPTMSFGVRYTHTPSEE